ncbi:DNA helicase [Tanacetum coccineum]
MSSIGLLGRSYLYTYYFRNGGKNFANGLHFPTGNCHSGSYEFQVDTNTIYANEYEHYFRSSGSVASQGKSSSRLTVHEKQQPKVSSSMGQFLTGEGLSTSILFTTLPTRINTSWAKRMRMSGGSSNQQNAGTQSFASTNVDTEGVSSIYVEIGDCQWSCNHCGARFWYGERLKGYANTRRPRYNKCYGRGKVVLQQQRDPPHYMKELLKDHRFLDNIRAYNQMFAMTSFGAHMNESINNRRGPYVFKISGQIYHWIGAMCPSLGDAPWFLQLYIYDTKHEVANRMRHFRGVESDGLDPQIVESMIAFLDQHNELFSLLFVYGEPEYYPEMRQNRTDKNRVSMTAYYIYQLHERFSLYGLLFRCGRLFQQKDYLLGVYDAIHKGDRVGSDIGRRLILPRSFTGGPRYMYSYYLDALAICRILGNPQFFITFTCNVNWPESKRHIEEFSEITAAYRVDVVVHVFEQKVQDFYNFLQDSKHFGDVTMMSTKNLRQGKIVLVIASSGIALLLLPAGRTAHLRFKLALDLTDNSICNIKKNIHAGVLLAETSLIIWDESPMNDRMCFEMLDITLRDIMDVPDKLFGGKSVVLGGDFRQTLPVKKGGSKTEIIAASIAESHLWSQFKVYTFTENMRNSTTDIINSKILSAVKGTSTIYKSSDEAIPVGNDGGEVELLYPTEYLNTLQLLGFPPPELELKVGAPIMLLRMLTYMVAYVTGQE